MPFSSEILHLRTAILLKLKPSYRRAFTTYSDLKELLLEMPKVMEHVTEAQKQRQKIKERVSKYAPSKVSLQILGTGAEGAPRSLYVFSDQGRYMFNCGEGTQRLAHEHKMKLARLEHIFVTQCTWANIGGLPGTALTIQDVGVPKISLHGPYGLNELFRATRKFVVMKNMRVETVECIEGQLFEDNVMSVYYAPLSKTAETYCADDAEAEVEKQPSLSSEETEEDESRCTNGNSRKRRHSITNSTDASKNSHFEDDYTDYYGYETSRKRLLEHHVLTEAQKETLMRNKAKATALCYACRLQPRPGSLSLDKCVSLGVPPGPLLGDLKSGKDVTLADGRLVRSEQVCEPKEPGPVFLVIDCPSDEYLDALANNAILSRHNKTAKSDADLACIVVHFTPSSVVNNSRYRSWIDSFSPSTQHLFINETNTCMGSVAVHRIQYKLNLLNAAMFPLLEGDPQEGRADVLDAGHGNLAMDFKENNLDLCGIRPRTFFTYHLRPKTGPDRSNEIVLSPAQYIDETYALDGFCDELSKLRVQLHGKSKNLSIRDYPKILFLGTGSCIPNKTRNTSGILLSTSSRSNILIDCGEGTCGQIFRFFGKPKALHVLANTVAVYLSHLHADHHIGLVGFLQGRAKARRALNLPPDEPVFLLAPKQILSWLTLYDLGFEDVQQEYKLISNDGLLKGSSNNCSGLDEAKRQELMDRLNMLHISTCYVKHCPNAFGVAFTHKSNYKITYSGDTMPCESLIALGADTDLLIHEATMEDDLAQEATVKMHSTTTQAIRVGHRMRAKSTLLTHFSQRYAKLPRFNDNFTDNVGIAFDNMMLSVDELPLVPLLFPSLRIMFAEHYEDMENKAIKRQRRQENIQMASLTT